MKIETTYNVGPVRHISCWSDLEIVCEDGSRVIVPMTTSAKESLAKSLLDRVKRDKQRELDNLQEELKKEKTESE
tara:strand:- start:113 stop:337 length:225 start_codon:yes stop_codon:yes gene_type:complete